MSADEMLLDDAHAWDLEAFMAWAVRRPPPVPLVLPWWLVESLEAQGTDVDLLAREQGFDGFTTLPRFTPRRRRRR